MDEKLKETDVLLVQEQGSDELKVVSGKDEKGNLKTVEPKEEMQTEFMKFDRQGNALENFISNFLRQAKNPTHWGFFKLPMNFIEATSAQLKEMLKAPDDPSNKELIGSAKVDTSKIKQEYQPLDANRIDWNEFLKISISKEVLEKSNAMDDMLNYRKSPLFKITITLGDITINTEARLSLREMEDGRIVPKVHAIKKEPQLDRPFYGNTFTPEDKKNLLETGNLGRIAELKMPNQKNPIRAFVSVDKLTNELSTYNADRVRIPNEIKGVTLNDEQKKTLAEGKEVYLEGMTAKSGKSFNATIQINADKRGFEFRFNNPQKQEQNVANKQAETRVLRIPNKLLGRDVSPEEQSKLKEGGTVYMTGLLDKKGEPFNAYVRPNLDKNKFDFLKWNPDQSQVKDVTPDNNSQTQVAVNSDGKSNEATKDVGEPLKQGQTEATPQQKQEQETKQEIAQKPKGRRM